MVIFMNRIEQLGHKTSLRVANSDSWLADGVSVSAERVFVSVSAAGATHVSFAFERRSSDWLTDYSYTTAIADWRRVNDVDVDVAA